MISIACSRSPPIPASSTPGSASSLSRKRWDSLTRVASGTLPDSATVRIGNSEVLTSLTRGSSVSAGSLALAMSTFSRTLRSAVSLSKPASNSRVTAA